MKPRILLTAGAAALACAQALAATPSAATGPWAQVPALPTACYSSQDPWSDRNYAAIDAVQEMLNAQEEKNTALDQQVSNAASEDPMAIAQGMQQAMLDDPANAQKMIEKMMQTGQQAQTEVPAQQEKEKQLEAESKDLLKRYQAALDKSMGPALAHWNSVQKRMGWETGSEFPFGPDPSWPEWAWKEWSAIQKERDAGYVATCAQWWGAGGAFPAYMSRYKDYLVQERIPYEKKLIDDSKLYNYKMLNVPADDYRTTTDFEAAIDYMKMASTVYGNRMADPMCRKETYCE
jgi:hypothetical protein